MRLLGWRLPKLQRQCARAAQQHTAPSIRHTSRLWNWLDASSRALACTFAENKKKTMFFKDSSRLKIYRHLKKIAKATNIYNIPKRTNNFSNERSTFFEAQRTMPDLSIIRCLLERTKKDYTHRVSGPHMHRIAKRPLPNNNNNNNKRRKKHAGLS